MRAGAVLCAALAAMSLGHDAAVGGEAQCLRAVRALSADSAASSQDFASAACPQIAPHPYRFDPAHGVTRTTRDIAMNEVVGTFPEFGVTMVRPGDTLELVASSGPVQIRRDVEALQAARPGQRLFVKARDGQILSVRYEDVAP